LLITFFLYIYATGMFIVCYLAKTFVKRSYIIIPLPLVRLKHLRNYNVLISFCRIAYSTLHHVPRVSMGK